MMFFGLLFWGAIIAAIVWLLSQGRGLPQTPTTRGPSALEILNERYARGEINREQYEQMRRDLEAR